MSKNWTIKTPDFSKYAETMTPHLHFLDYKDAPTKTEIELKKMNKTLEDQLRLARDEASSAKKDALIARKEARFAKIISVIAIIVPVVQEYVFPYIPKIIQSVFELL